jgi:hypothetical protein
MIVDSDGVVGGVFLIQFSCSFSTKVTRIIIVPIIITTHTPSRRHSSNCPVLFIF